MDNWRTFFSVSLVIVIITGCSDDKPSGPNPQYPIIYGTVRDAADSSVIEGANVMLYDANANEPVNRMFTDAEGCYGFDVEEGNYHLKVEALGYYPTPPKDGAPIPFQTIADDTTWQVVYLDQNPNSSTLGGFSGTVKTAADEGIPGVLVIASSAPGVYSGASGFDGYYVFFNIPPGTYMVECHKAGYMQDSTGITTSVIAGSITQDIDLLMAAGTFGMVSGNVAFVAVSNPDSGIDITMIHPEAQEAIPGLSTFINPTSSAYTISNIPYDTYIVWASYRNDGYVMDPDAIHKFGLAIATLSESNPDTTINFKATGAVQLISPTNVPDSVYPVPVYTSKPTFTWMKTSSYASVKEYVIEVFNSKGEVIWGGFDSNGVIKHPKIEPGDTISVVYNFDSSAVDSLHVGETYRWKVYADDDATANVQTLLSSSERLMGLFKVIVDTSLVR